MKPIILTRTQLDELGLDYPENLVSAELHLGAAEAACHHLPGTGLPCVLYLRTPSGTRGTGAHPGFVIELDPAVLEALGATHDDIYRAAGARTCAYRDQNNECSCGECQDAVGFDNATELLESDPEYNTICPSCVIMIAEGWDDALRLADEREAISALFP